jgi:hypothetical protein
MEISAFVESVLTGVIGDTAYDSLKILLNSQGIFLDKIEQTDIPKLLKKN